MSSKRRLLSACAYTCLSLMVLSVPDAAVAQEIASPVSASPISDAALAAASTHAMPEARGEIDAGPKRGLLVPLYISFAALQALDAHSTIHAMSNGAHEMNPMMKGIAGQPAALIAVKSGVAAATILAADKLRIRSRTGAIVLMAAANSLCATVVASNYSTIASLR